MQPLCPTPDELFSDVPNLSDTIKITGTRAFAHGGYSDIWRGVSWSGDVTRDVAIKIIRVTAKQHLGIDRIKMRISREVITWCSVKHKNIMPFFGLYWLPDGKDELPSMVYPYCAAGTCTEYLKAHPEANRMEIIYQVADGLIYLHAAKVVHGDIKACNILMQDDGTPLLADFGLSRIIAEVSTGLTTSSSRGSLRWMAHELFGGIESQVVVLVTTASDVWAFACLCLEILTGHHPWASIKNEAGVMRAIVVERRRPPLMPPVQSNHIGHILQHCWTLEPESRPTMSELAKVLQAGDPSYLHKPHCILDPSTQALSELPPPILNADVNSFTQEFFMDSPLISSSGLTKTPLAPMPIRNDEPLFPPLTLPPRAAPPQMPVTPSSDTTGATPYLDSLHLTPSDSMPSEPSSGLVSRDEPSLFGPNPRPLLPTYVAGPERWPKTTRETRVSSNSLRQGWPRTPSSASSVPPGEQDGVFRPDLWQKSDPSTPSSVHTRSSSRGSIHYPTPPRTESYHSQYPPMPQRPSRQLSMTPVEGYFPDRSNRPTVLSSSSSSRSIPVTPTRSLPDHRRGTNVLPVSPPQSHSPSYRLCYPPPPQGGWSPTSTVPRGFRPAQSTAIRITTPDGRPVVLPDRKASASPVKGRGYS